MAPAHDDGGRTCTYGREVLDQEVHMLRLILAGLFCVVGLGVVACGDDDAPERVRKAAPAQAVAYEGSLERYCTTARRLDSAGEKFFSRLGEDAGPKEFKAAERRFVQRFARDIEELEQAAPREIKADVVKVLAGQRQRAGLAGGDEVSEGEASAAEERVKAYEKDNCNA
jgi:hypothetical protein